MVNCVQIHQAQALSCSLLHGFRLGGEEGEKNKMTWNFFFLIQLLQSLILLGSCKSQLKGLN